MRITIERLRTSIVVLAALLVTAILLFFAYARYRVRHIGRDLPGKLGIEVQQSTNGFTFSKSEKGHTLFTLHASKAVQYKGGGRALLHDVSITVYGKDNLGADHISGSEFEYDPASGTARAMGEVQIDLTTPGGNGGAGGGTPIHVRTSGLVFNQRTGVAETSEALQFASEEAGGRSMQGSAKGASYHSADGMLRLNSDVVFRAVMDNGPVAVRAQSAEFMRASRLLTLRGETAEFDGEQVASETATTIFRPDGTAERVEVSGDVYVSGKQGEQLHSAWAKVQMDGKGQPQTATLRGGVHLAAIEGGRALEGSAETGVLALGPRGVLQRLQLYGSAHVLDRESTPAGRAVTMVREASASHMDVGFGRGTAGRAEARTLLAQGNALIAERQRAARASQKGEGQQETTLGGDRLEAALAEGNVLTSVKGSGKTQWSHSSSNGIRQTSRGEMLEVSFAKPAPRKASARKGRNKAAALDTSAVERAVQRGGVEMVQVAPPPPEQTEPLRSTAQAEEAVYDGATETVRLQGGTPRLTQASSEVTASAIDFSRATGDVTATGEVKATYRQTPRASAAKGAVEKAGEPLHAVADHAFFDHAGSRVRFWSDGEGESRMWQGDASVSAPELVFARTAQTLTARGASSQVPVRATFPVKADKRADGAALAMARIEGSTLLYSAMERRAIFSGSVVAREGDAELRAQKAEVFLSATASAAQKSDASSQALHMPGFSGSVERIVARGDVRIAEAARHGSGDKLVYTAEDGRFVLTGTAQQRPALTDPAHGTVTGSSLIFNNRDGSVVVNGGASPAVTETRVAK